MDTYSDRKRLWMMTVVFSVVVSFGIAVLILAINENDSLERFKRNGICIGYAVEAPYAFNLPNGDVTGESPEIARRIANLVGIHDITWRQVEFGSLIDELMTGHIDLIAAGMFITPERSGKIGFSNPTFCVRQGLLVSEGNPKKLHSYKQIATDSNVNIAVLAGSVELDDLKKLGARKQQLQLVSDANTGLHAVESGVADCLVLSSPTVNWMAMTSKFNPVETAKPFHQSSANESGFGAFGFRIQDKDLLEAWNKALKSFIGTREHIDLIASFGFTPEDIPKSSTLIED